MTAEGITPVVMPKWGLSMTEGKVVEWLVAEGADIAVGDELMEVETDKIDGAVEATDAGPLRRRVAETGKTYPVKALLGVLAGPEVPDSDIDGYVAAYEIPEVGEEGEEADAYSFVAVNGIRVRYGRQGTGPPTVLVHGFGGDLDNWLFNIGALAAVADVVAVDLPGHGQSALTLPGTTVADLAGFVVAFLDTIGVERVYLIGHSLGGAVASQVALDHPDRVLGLGLVAPAGFGADINAGYLDTFVASPSRKELKAALATLFADDALVTRSMVDGVLRYKRLDGVTELLGSLRDGVFPGGAQASQPGPHLGGIAVPVTIVWGGADRVIPADHSGAAPTGATVTVLAGAGHMVQMERPHEVNEILVRLVSSEPDQRS